MNFPSLNFMALLITLLSFNSFACCQNTSKVIFLNGTLKNFGKNVQVEDMSELKELKLQDSSRMLLIDSAGNFSISFKLNGPNYFRIGRNILYLTPGDSIFMALNYNRPDSTIFKGKNSESNEFLKYTPYPKGGSFLESGDSIKFTLQKTINTILLNARKREKLLDTNKQLTAKFKSLEKARVRADVINSLIFIDFYFPYVHKLSNDSAVLFRKGSKQIIEKYVKHYCRDFLNQEFLKIVVYRDIISRILKENISKSKNVVAIMEWLNAKTILQKIKQLKKFENNSKLEQEISIIKQKDYKAAIQAAFNKVTQFNIGDNAIDFDMVNIEGESVSLKKYEGKVIFIDLWATWCLPCLEEMPFLDSLKQYYKGNNGLVFISLSIDNNNYAWKKYLTENGRMQETEYIIDRLKLTAYSVDVIPRTIIIAQDYKIEMLNGPLPSAKETKSIINSLLEKINR